MPGILRSILAVVGGYVTMAIVVMLFTAVVKTLSPSWFASEGAPVAPYLAVNICYSFIAAFAGGYVVAWIAARFPLQHAVALGGLVLVMSIVSAMQYGNRQPRWYQALLAMLMPLAAILGGWLRAWRS